MDNAKMALKHSNKPVALMSRRNDRLGDHGVDISFYQDGRVDKPRALRQHRSCNPIETG